MDIRQIKSSDISAVTALHIRTLPSAIARIGNPYLSDLYHALDKNLCLVAVDDAMIVGVISATQDLKKHKNRCCVYFFSTRTFQHRFSNRKTAHFNHRTS